MRFLCSTTLLFALSACAPATVAAPTSDAPSFDDLLLRDFRKDGKYDESGHPINAIVVQGGKVCANAGAPSGSGFLTDGRAAVNCDSKLPALPSGDLVANVRVRPIGIDTYLRADAIKISIDNGGGSPPKVATYSGRSFRQDGKWAFIPVRFTAQGATQLRIETFALGQMEIDYVEIFPDDFTLAMGPGSRTMGDDEIVTLEVGKGQIPKLTVNGTGVDLDALVATGAAHRADTTYRRVYNVAVGALARGITSDLDLRATSKEAAARMMVYRTVQPCLFKGDARGQKVLLTGFHPFPADASHENISEVAVLALDPTHLSGAQVMRLVLPVEYDDAPARVVDAIQRCAPDVVVDLGQGGGSIDLERTAYNLKDTGSDPDNRGFFQAGVPIAEAGAATLPSGLPLIPLRAALASVVASQAVLGDVKISDSDDPGRYVCNDVFYGAVTEATSRSIRAGFIHLPYFGDAFSDELRAAWGEVAAQIVNAAVKPAFDPNSGI